MTGCRGTNVRRMQQGILIRIVVRSTTGLEDPSSRRVVRSPTRDRAVERHLSDAPAFVCTYFPCVVLLPLAACWLQHGMFLV